MEVKLDKRYPLDVDAQRAWKLLTDVPATAGCMPGAAITEKVDDTHYKGAVKVKVGPAAAAFSGEIEVLALDVATQTLQLLGKGADRGGSSASMGLTATIEAGDTPSTSVLVGHAEVIVNGKFAQFGGRLMVQVSDMLLAQFVENFKVAAAALPLEAAPVAAGQAAPVDSDIAIVEASAATTAAAVTPELAAAQAASAAITAAATSATASATPAPQAAQPQPSRPAAAPAQANEINALAIFWHLLKGWFAGLFGKRA
jgi:carbon monoxide dehydrogenase subunit G